MRVERMVDGAPRSGEKRYQAGRNDGIADIDQGKEGLPEAAG